MRDTNISYYKKMSEFADQHSDNILYICNNYNLK